jgi:hypothetical protein
MVWFGGKRPRKGVFRITQRWGFKRMRIGGRQNKKTTLAQVVFHLYKILRFGQICKWRLHFI